MTVGFEPTPWIGPEPKSGVLDLSTTSSYIHPVFPPKWKTDCLTSTFLDAIDEESRHHEALAKHIFKLQREGKRRLVPYSGSAEKLLFAFEWKLITHETNHGINIHHLFIPFQRSSCQLPIKSPFRGEKWDQNMGE